MLLASANNVYQLLAKLRKPQKHQKSPNPTGWGFSLSMRYPDKTSRSRSYSRTSFSTW